VRLADALLDHLDEAVVELLPRRIDLGEGLDHDQRGFQPYPILEPHPHLP
jgi:hypothetical protein